MYHLPTLNRGIIGADYSPPRDQWEQSSLGVVHLGGEGKYNEYPFDLFCIAIAQLAGGFTCPSLKTNLYMGSGEHVSAPSEVTIWWRERKEELDISPYVINVREFGAFVDYTLRGGEQGWGNSDPSWRPFPVLEARELTGRILRHRNQMTSSFLHSSEIKELHPSVNY